MNGNGTVMQKLGWSPVESSCSEQNIQYERFFFRFHLKTSFQPDIRTSIQVVNVLHEMRQQG